MNKWVAMLKFPVTMEYSEILLVAQIHLYSKEYSFLLDMENDDTYNTLTNFFNEAIVYPLEPTYNQIPIYRNTDQTSNNFAHHVSYQITQKQNMHFYLKQIQNNVQSLNNLLFKKKEEPKLVYYGLNHQSNVLETVASETVKIFSI